MAVPTAVWDRIRLAGEKVHGELIDAVTDVMLERRIDQASTFKMFVRDPEHQFIRSRLLSQRSICRLDDSSYELVGVLKDGAALTLTFEAAGIADLRRKKGRKKVKAGTMTRTEFARSLVDEARWLKFRGERGEISKMALMRGGKRDPDETSWECLRRLAAERAWRCFENEGTVYFGSDEWLLDVNRVEVVRPSMEGILEIDFDYDAGKRAERATITCRAPAWTIRPGFPVGIEEMGPLVQGKWLVEAIERPSLSLDHTIVTLVRKVRQLPEPKNAAQAHRQAYDFDVPLDFSTGGSIKGGGITAVGKAIENLGHGFVVSEHKDFGGVTLPCDGLPGHHAKNSGHCKATAIDVNWRGYGEGGLPGPPSPGQKFTNEREALAWLAKWIARNVGGVVELYWPDHDPHGGHETHLHLMITADGGLIQKGKGYSEGADPPQQPTRTSSEVRSYIYANWPGGAKEKARAVAVAGCESGFRDNAKNLNSNGSIDRGAFQINDIHEGSLYQRSQTLQLYEIQFNVEIAIKLWRRDGWRPWVCAHKLGYV